MGRKNWLFANTEGGAQSSAIVYSLIETAKENGLDPYRYLVHVFSKAPGLAVTDKNWAAKLLPENIPQNVVLQRNRIYLVKAGLPLVSPLLLFPIGIIGTAVWKNKEVLSCFIPCRLSV